MGEVTSRPLSGVAGQVKEPFASAKADVTVASHSVPGAASSPGRLPGVPCLVWSVLWGRLWEVPGFRDTHSSPCPLRPGWSHPFYFGVSPGMGQTGLRFKSRLCHLQAGWAGCLRLVFSESSSPEMGDGHPLRVDQRMTEDTCDSAPRSACRQEMPVSPCSDDGAAEGCCSCRVGRG